MDSYCAYPEKASRSGLVGLLRRLPSGVKGRNLVENPSEPQTPDLLAAALMTRIAFPSNFLRRLCTSSRLILGIWSTILIGNASRFSARAWEAYTLSGKAFAAKTASGATSLWAGHMSRSAASADGRHNGIRIYLPLRPTSRWRADCDRHIHPLSYCQHGHGQTREGTSVWCGEWRRVGVLAEDSGQAVVSGVSPGGMRNIR